MGLPETLVAENRKSCEAEQKRAQRNLPKNAKTLTASAAVPPEVEVRPRGHAGQRLARPTFRTRSAVAPIRRLDAAGPKCHHRLPTLFLECEALVAIRRG
jgi:hypothetical protein